MKIDSHLYEIIRHTLWAEIHAELLQQSFYYPTKAFFRLPSEPCNQLLSKHTMKVKTESLEYLLSYRVFESQNFLEITFLLYEQKACHEFISEIMQKTSADALIIVDQICLSYEQKQSDTLRAFIPTTNSDSKIDAVLSVVVKTKQGSWLSKTPIVRRNESLFLAAEPESFAYAGQCLTYYR